MKINIEIPETLNDLTLHQWQKITALASDKDVSDDFFTRKVLHIVYGIEPAIFDKVPIKDIEVMTEAYEKVNTDKAVFKQRFTMNGIEYGFIPNIDDISFGEFIDIDSNTKPEKYHKLMSILFRPVQHKSVKDYSIAEYQGTSDDLLDMPLGIALGAVTFFLTLGKQLLNAILKSLEQEQPQKLKEALRKSGVGMHQLTFWQRAISGNTMMLPQLRSMQPSLS